MEIFASMCLPEIARIDRVIPKKQFYENGNLSTTDKKLFENVEKIYWRYALKTENCFLGAYQDEKRDYPEIEVLEVKLRQEKQLKRLAEVIMGAIPYPMLLFFHMDNHIQLYMGMLRQNQADSWRMTLETMESTDWLSEEDVLWRELAIRKVPATNFYLLYKGLFDTISKHHLRIMNVPTAEISGHEARDKLRTIQELEKEITKLRKQMKSERQFNRKMEYNSKLQKLKKAKVEIMGQGSKA